MVIIRIKAVKEKTGLSRSTIYEKISEGSFPRQISLGARAVGWIESEVDGWVTEQVSRSRSQSNCAPSPNTSFRKPESQARPQIGCASDPMGWGANLQRTIQGNEGVPQ